MLDTSILVELLRGRADHLLDRLEQDRDSLCLSAITAMELDYGAERSSKREAMRHDVDQMLTLVAVLEYDRAAARQTGLIRAHLASQGATIGLFDSLIAGHALSRGLTVVTRNLSEFSRVSGLATENWLS